MCHVEHRSFGVDLDSWQSSVSLIRFIFLEPTTARALILTVSACPRKCHLECVFGSTSVRVMYDPEI